MPSEFFHELLSISGFGGDREGRGDQGRHRGFPALGAGAAGNLQRAPDLLGICARRTRGRRRSRLAVRERLRLLRFDAKLEEMRAYLRMMGYLHIRRVFAGSESTPSGPGCRCHGGIEAGRREVLVVRAGRRARGSHPDQLPQSLLRFLRRTGGRSPGAGARAYGRSAPPGMPPSTASTAPWFSSSLRA